MVFELPRLRGVPPVNEKVDNLFEVVIPYLKIAHDYDLQLAIEAHAAVRFRTR